MTPNLILIHAICWCFTDTDEKNEVSDVEENNKLESVPQDGKLLLATPVFFTSTGASFSDIASFLVFTDTISMVI